LANGRVTYQLLDGTIKTFSSDELIRLDLGPGASAIPSVGPADLADPEIIALIKEAMAKPLDETISRHNPAFGEKDDAGIRRPGARNPGAI
jgi:hypothetical protein